MYQSTFVGRKNELDLLEQLLIHTREGYGKLVFVNGELGAGKSSLIRKFLMPLDADSLVTIVECSDRGGIHPYIPIREVLVELNAVAFSKTAEGKKKALKCLRGVINEAGADWIAAIPVFGALAAAGINSIKAAREHLEKPLKASDVGGTKEIQRFFENELRRLAEKQTVIIFLKDLQWADPSTLNILFALGRSLRTAPFPLLMIGSYRSHEINAGKSRILENGSKIHIPHPLSEILDEFRSQSRPEENRLRKNWVIEMEVLPLEQQDIADLINNEFQVNNFPVDFVPGLENLTQGNPLFVRAILGFLKQHGDIFQDENGVFQLKRDVLKTLPKSIEAVIRMRVTCLDKDQRKILDYAGICGEKFAIQIIEPLLKMDELDLVRHLGELNKKYDLISSDRSESLNGTLLDFYRFKNALFRKYVYESLDAAERRVLHRKAAETLKTLYGDAMRDLKEVEEQYKRHVQIGNGWVDGITLQLTKNIVKDKSEVENLLEAAASEVEAAELNYKQYAIEECLERIKKALTFLEKLQETPLEAEEIKFNALFLECKAKDWLAQYEETGRTAKRLLDIAKKQNNKKYIAVALKRLGKSNFRLGKHDNAIELHQKALTIFENLGDRENMADSYNHIGSNLRANGESDKAVEYHQKALAIFRSLNYSKDIAGCNNNIGAALHSNGKYWEAIKHYQKAFKIFEELNDKGNMADSYENIGNALRGKGKYDKAIDQHQKALAIYTDLKDWKNIADCYTNIGNALTKEKDFDGANEYYEKALAIYKDCPDKPGTASIYNNIGALLNAKGLCKDAIDYYKKALAINKQLKNRINMALNYNNIGDTLRSEGNYDAALGYYKKALEIGTSLGNKVCIAREFMNIGTTLLEEGAYDGAIEHYKKALDVYEILRDGRRIIRCHISIGLALDAKGYYDGAIEHFKEALPISGLLDDRRSKFYILSSLGDIFNSKKDFDAAIDHYKDALKNLGPYMERAEVDHLYSKIGAAFYSIKDYDRAVKYYDKASKLSKNVVPDLNIMADSYYKKGNALQSEEDYEDAIGHYKKALAIYQRLQNKGKIAQALDKIAEAFKAGKKYDSAIDFYEKELKSHQDLRNEEQVAYCHEQIAALLLASNPDPYIKKRALICLRKAHDTWKTLENEKEMQRLSKKIAGIQTR